MQKVKIKILNKEFEYNSLKDATEDWGLSLAAMRKWRSVNKDKDKREIKTTMEVVFVNDAKNTGEL